MENFISEAENKLQHVLNELGWSLENMGKEEDEAFTNCPKNPGHRVRSSNLADHVEKCNGNTARARGDFDDLSFPPCLEEGPASFKWTAELQEDIINNAASKDPLFRLGSRGSHPRPVAESTSEFLLNFTRDERRALYDHVIANTHRRIVIRQEDLALETNAAPEPKREMTALELAVAERDAKRRRATYRNKVHTNRKTHTEIIKEVIESQMSHMIENPTKSKSEDLDESYSAKETHSGHGGEQSWKDPGHRDRYDRGSYMRDRRHHEHDWDRERGFRDFRASSSRREEEKHRRDRHNHDERKNEYHDGSYHHSKDYRHRDQYEREKIEHRHRGETRQWYGEKRTYRENKDKEKISNNGTETDRQTGLDNLDAVTENDFSFAKKDSSESETERTKKAKKRKKDRKHQHKKSKKKRHKRKSSSSSSDSSS